MGIDDIVRDFWNSVRKSSFFMFGIFVLICICLTKKNSNNTVISTTVFFFSSFFIISERVFILEVPKTYTHSHIKHNNKTRVHGRRRRRRLVNSFGELNLFITNNI